MAWIVLAVIGFVVIGSVVYVVGLYNGLISLKHAIDQAWANIDVLLKQRHDELPKLMDTVKGYMGHEREVLERVTAARTAYQQAQTMEQKGAADDAVRGALGPALRGRRELSPAQGRCLVPPAARADLEPSKRRSPTAASSLTTVSTPSTSASSRSPTCSSPG